MKTADGFVMRKRKHTEKKQKYQIEYKNASRYMVYVIRCILNQLELKKFPTNITWKTIWVLAKRNCVEALMGRCLQGYSEVPAEIRMESKRICNETLYRQLCFDVEREQVVRELEKQKLAYLMLKGINISKYYPGAGMRWMSDNDILCAYIQPEQSGGYRTKGDNAEEVRFWEQKAREGIQIAMERCGFTLKDKGVCHDAYIKQPMFKFEMHHQLFEETMDEGVSQYYQNPWKRAMQDEENPYLYYYSKEDEYLYMVTHAYKHFSRSGSGIRTLIDMYVYLKNNESMDWNYISMQLKILKQEEFELLLRNTVIHAFSVGGKLTTQEWDTIFYMIGSGTFGTSQNRIQHCLEKLEKEEGSTNKVWGYMKDRLWMKEDMMKIYYPFFYYHRYFRFFMPVYRILKGIVIHPKTIWIEWKVLFKAAKRKE